MKINALLLLAVVFAFVLGGYIYSHKNPVMSRIVSVNPLEFNGEIKNDDAVILDIRTPQEYNSGRIAGAINIDFYQSDFRERLNELDKDKKYKIYCNSGNRSSEALLMMQELGFTNVSELEGGIQSWKLSKLPTCTNC